ncbi:MAG: septum formation initiator family protein [Pedosphaera sp.]|nr:septum formation initiator family protein [Pedosphaera sp.]
MTSFGTWIYRMVLTLVFVAFLLGAGLKYLPLLKSNQARRAELQRKVEFRDSLAATNRMLEARNQALKNDPKTVERTAREVLGYARPGEKVVRFEEPRK